MNGHPEQHLINIIIDGDLGGVDELNAEQNHNAWKLLSDDGKKELERQRKEVRAGLDELEKRSIQVLYFMPSDSTKH